MAKYIQDKNGRFAGSIGDGKAEVPTASDTPVNSSDPTTDVSPVDYASISQAVPLTSQEVSRRYREAVNDPVSLVNLADAEQRLGWRDYGVDRTGESYVSRFSQREGGMRRHAMTFEGGNGYIVSIEMPDGSVATVHRYRTEIWGADTEVNTVDGTVYLLRGTRLSNSRGPAVTRFDGTQEYWRNGKHRCTITPDGHTLTPDGQPVGRFAAWLRRNF